MYYCLIASLEQYSLSTDPKSVDFDVLRTEIKEEMTSKDIKIVELLYGYYDVVNILNRLSGRDTLHNPLGNLTAEEIDAEIEGAKDDDEVFVSKLPVGVSYALDLIKGRVEREDENEDELKGDEQVEKLLLANFYKACEENPNRFLRAWCDADRKIREVCAEQISSDEDYKEESWWSALQSVLMTEDFVERERKMDALRWNYSAELLEPGGIDGEYHQFDLASVLNYLIELNILQRWGSLSKEIGRERFEKMVKSFTSKGDINLEVK